MLHQYQCDINKIKSFHARRKCKDNVTVTIGNSNNIQTLVKMHAVSLDNVNKLVSNYIMTDTWRFYLRIDMKNNN